MECAVPRLSVGWFGADPSLHVASTVQRIESMLAALRL